MKTNITPVFAALLMLLASCSKEFNSPASTRTNTQAKSLAATKQAFILIDNRDIDLSSGYLEFNACTGEQVKVVSGIWHIHAHAAFSAGMTTFTIQTNTSDYRMISLSTGVSYTGIFSSMLTDVRGYTNFPIAITEKLRLVLTTPGGGNNGVITADFHATVDANNVLRTYVENITGGCR